MISDFLLGIVHAIAELFVGLLPAMPEKPEVIDGAGYWLGMLNWFLPVEELWGFVTGVIVPVVAVLLLIRFIRVVRSG